MSYEPDSYYSVYNERFPRSRKPRQCEACKETIPAGAHYARVSAVYDGSAETIVRCIRCQRMHEHLRLLARSEGLWPAERLNCGREYVEEWGEEPPEEIAALAFALPGEV